MNVNEVARGLKLLAIAESFMSASACQIGLMGGTLPWAWLLSEVAYVLQADAGMGIGFNLLGLVIGVVLVCLVSLPFVWIIALVAKQLQVYADCWRNITNPKTVETGIWKGLAMALACVPTWLIVLPFWGISSIIGRIGMDCIREARIKSDNTDAVCPLLDIIQSHPVPEQARSKDQTRAYKKATAFLFLKLGGILMLTSLVGVILIQANTDSESRVLLASTLAFSIYFLVFCPLSIYAVNRMRRNKALVVVSLDVARAADSRPPILLLRSFKDESKLSSPHLLSFLDVTRSAAKSLEEQITERLWRFGPVIALGHPEDGSPPVGAAREYIACGSDDDWREKIKGYWEQCTAIVLVAGNTKGIAWEIQHVFKHNRSDRLLIIIPPWMTDAEWAECWLRSGIEPPPEVFSIGLGADRLLGVVFLKLGVNSYRGRPNQFGYEAISVIGAAEIVYGNARNDPSTV